MPDFKLKIKLFISLFLLPIFLALAMFTNVNAVAGPPTTAPITVTINQESSQADPTNLLTTTFKVVFSSPIDVTGFSPSDISTSGSTAPGVLVNSVAEIAPNDGTTFDVVITATGSGTIVPTIPVSTFAYGAGVKSTNASTNTFATNIVLDSAGTPYFFGSNNKIYTLDSAGVFNLFATSTGVSPNNGIFDSAGNLYVTNTNSNTVTKITPAGVATAYGTTGGTPIALAFDAAGNLYVANVGASNVTKIPAGGGAGVVLAATGGSPESIILDAAGNVYTSNYTAGTMTKITPAGVATTFATTGAGSLGMVVDSAGNFYVANQNANTISKVTSAGVSSLYATLPAGSLPYRLELDSAGNLYVTDVGTNSISKITPAGVVSSFATGLSGPSGIVIDSLGNIFVENFGANGITKFSYAVTGGVSNTANVGNAVSTSSDNSVTIDNTPPATLSMPDMDPTTDSGNSNTDNITSNTSPLFTGTCVVGDTIKLSSDSVAFLPTQVCPASGIYSISPTTPLTQGSHLISATATDPVGNVSTGSPNLAITIDNVAPVAPTCTATPNPSNLTVAVTISCTGLEVGTYLTSPGTTCTPSPSTSTTGTCTGTAANSVTGPATTTATQTDVAGNAQPVTIPFVVDTTPPSAPATPDMTAATDTGVSSTDNLTNDTTPDITGACTPGDLIILQVDNVGVLPTQVCPAGGVYTITLATPLADGPHNITATATDPAGNVSAASPTPLTITVDTVVPSTPTCVAVPNPSNQTQIAVVTCTGVGVGDTITIPGAVCAPSPALGTGVVNCNANTVTTFAGPTIPVTVTDPAGNTTPVTVPFVVDLIPPSMIAAPDMTAATDSGLSNTDNITNDTTPDFTGACTPGDTIKLMVDLLPILPNQVCPVTAVYLITPSVPLTSALHSVTATATDPALNTSLISPALPVTIDTVTPSTPTISPVKTTDTTITGTGDPTDKINLTGATCTNAPVIVASNGTWSCTLAAPLPDGTLITATQTDVAGNTSVPVTTTVYGPSPTKSQPPVINPISNADVVVTGSGIPGATVNLTNATCTNAAVIVNIAGEWKCTLATPLTTGTVVTATETEPGKTVSGPVSTKVSDALTTSPSAPVMYPTDGSPISGTGEPGDTVTVKDPTNAVVCTALVQPDGTWTCTPAVIPANGTILTGTQTDPQGNVSGPAHVTVDSSAPAAPTIDPIKSTDTQITGNGEPGDLVTVTGATCTNTPIYVDVNGEWKCLLAAPLPVGTVVTAIQTDPTGNVSDPTTTTVYNPITKSAPPTLNPVNNVDKVITGLSVVGALINLPGITCTNAPVITDGAGMWKCNLATPLTTGTIVTATSTEVGKTVSDPATTKVSDAAITSPSAPVLNPTDGSPITGTGEPGATVTVKDPTGTVLCTAVVNAAGTWSCTPATIPTDGTILTATQTDGGGNISPPAFIKVDQTAGSTPTINPIKTTDPVVTGTGEPGDIVNLTGATCTNAPIIVSANGTWSCTLVTKLPEGTVVTATLTDPAGNVSSPATTTVYDNSTKSQTPVINPINNLDKVITGSGVPGATIAISGATCTNSPVVVNPAGTWICNIAATLPVGTVVTATATEPGKTGSMPTSTKVSDASTTSPSAPVVNPTDGSPISGTGEPGATVKVVDPSGVVVCTAVVQADGTWSCTPATIPPGGTILTVTQTDGGGHVSPPTFVKVDAYAPAPPVINPIKTTDLVITGTGEPGAAINVTGATCTNVVIVKLDGTWSCTISATLPEGKVVSATLTDPAGNTSAPSSTTVYDEKLTSAPPVLNPINDLDKSITGTGTPGATITLIGITCTNSPIIVDAFGNWECKLATPLVAGTIVEAVSVDPGRTPSGKVKQQVVLSAMSSPSAPIVYPTMGFVVTGTGEPGAVITIKDSKGEILCSTTVQADGTWSCTLEPSQPDGVILTVTQMDSEGNISPPAHVKVDRTAPPAPTINPFSSTDNVITGTGIPGNLIHVTGVSCTNDPIIVDLKGNWKCILSLPVPTGNTVTVTQTDPAGNVSAPYTLSSSDDLDGDGVVDAVEKLAPNNGDGNGDGTKDYLQANVLSILNAYTTAYITLELPATGDCRHIISYSVNKENQATKLDSAYDYPVGLLNFKLQCSGVATIKQYWYGLELTKTFIARKYSTTNQSYNTLTNVNISKTGAALVFDYQIAEGSSLDDSPAGDGFVVDPIGPAVPAGTTANTGNDFTIYFIVGFALVGIATGAVVFKKKYLHN